MSNVILINDQKQAGESILERLTKYFKTEEIFLAGGMLREHYFNRAGEDFDIYMECPQQVDSSIAELMINGLEGFEDFSIMTSESYVGGYNNLAVDFVLEGKFKRHSYSTNILRDNKVQIIFLKTNTMPVYAYLQDVFCCSLSKVWKQYQRHTVYHGHFLENILSRKIKFDWSHFEEINYDYIKKILKRYPEFEVDESTIGNYLRELSKEAYR